MKNLILVSTINFHDLKSNPVFLHCISSVAALEVTVPLLLLASHRYCPLSDLLTFITVNCLLSAPKLILGSPLVLIADPFLVHDIDGAGSPLALQDNVTFSPSVTVAFCGCVVISGATVIRK